MSSSIVRRFGFDLDNTIIDYELSVEQYCLYKKLPELNKIHDLRRYLREIDSSDQQWQEAQSWIYLNGLDYAKLSQGVSELCQQLSNKEIALYIVSHKTKQTQERFGGQDLLSPATKWIQESEVGKYFNVGTNLYFASSRAEKIQRITQLSLTWFVDDLLEVLCDEEFPSSTGRYLFSLEKSLELPQEITVVDSFNSLREIFLHE